MPKYLKLVPFRSLKQRVAALEQDGYVYFPGILTDKDVNSLRHAMDRLESRPEEFDRLTDHKDHRYLNKSINNVFNRDPVFLPYLDRPDIIDVVEAAHGSDCHVIGMTAWMTGPGRPDQSIHVDWQPLVLPEDVMDDPRVTVPVYITTAHYYLDDISESMGPTQFIPGSHRAGRKPSGGESTWRGIKPQSLLCSAGDVVLFRCEVWHRGTANTSDRVRYLLQVHYAQRMITQKFPPYLNQFRFDSGILSQATDRQRRLLGEHEPSNYD